MITDKTKKRGIAAAIVAAAAWMVVLTAHSCGAAKPQGFQTGGGIVLGGGNGLTKVTTNSSGLLGGSGTTTNPLTATLTVSTPVSGTGSSGSPLTSSGDISAVTAGSGLSGGASSGAATLAVNAGSGITADGTSTRVASGSGLTFSSGNLITNAGSGLTYSSGALITNAGSGMTYVAGALQPSLGTGLAFSGANIVPNLTGGTCTVGRAVTSVAADGTATCGDVGRNDYAGTHFEWAEEFGGMASTSAGTGMMGFLGNQWQLQLATSGAFTANQGATTRPGIAEFTIATNAGSISGMSSSTSLVDFASGSWTYEWVGGWSVLSNATDEFYATLGFYTTNSSVNQTNGCYFNYDRANTATAPGTGSIAGGDLWQIWCANASTRTGYTLNAQTTGAGDGSFLTVNSPIAAFTSPSTNIYHLKIVMTLNTKAEFFINGTKVGEIRTNISSGSSRAAHGMTFQRNAGSTNVRRMQVDFGRVAVDLSSARSP